MVRMLISAAVWVASAAVGLLVADWVLDGVSVDLLSLLLVAAIFAACQAILQPFVLKVAARNAPALMGGVGLITCLIALVITVNVTNGLAVTGIDTWVLAALVIWIVTMLASLLLPLLVAKRVVSNRRSET